MPIYRDFALLGSYTIVPLLVKEEIKEKSVDSEKESLLRMIYTIDPESNLPVGDISKVLGKNLSPEVVTFIKDNLMQDVSKLGAFGMPAGVDDDVALTLTRDVGETRSQYIERVKSYMADEKETIRQYKMSIEKRANVESPKDD